MSDWMIKAFDYQNAREDEYRALYHFTVAMRKERYPHDPPLGASEFVGRLKSIPEAIDMRGVVAITEDGDILGEANSYVMPGDDNPHLMQAAIEVHPQQRRRGIGRRLLGFVAEEALRRDRTLTILESFSTDPAGESFAKRIGASLGVSSRTNQLVLGEVDRALVQRWIDAAPVSEFELHFVEDAYPEELLGPLAELFNAVLNDVPLYDLDMEDAHYSPDLLRYLESMLLDSGGKRWSALVTKRGEGIPVGYSEISWHPNRGHIVQQQGTGVAPGYRERGLGGWLKAAVLDRLLHERPEVQYIRSTHIAANAAMLHINEALGFRTYFTSQIWQVETDALLAYLG